MPVKAIPEGFHSLTPGLTCKNASAAIDLYKKVFGAVEHNRMAGPDGKIVHAELGIGDSRMFLADEFPGMSAAPAPGSAPSQSMYLYVENVDALYQKAIDAGCTGAMPVADMFWGDRMGALTDRWGNRWTLAQHIKDMTPEEMRAASEKAAAEWRQGKK